MLKSVRMMNIGLAFAASGLLAAGQDQQAKPVPAGAPLVISKVQVELDVPVQNLTKENAAKVEENLEGLKLVLYECAGCHDFFEKAGSCCNSALTTASRPILDTVTVTPDDAKVKIKTEEGIPVRLSDIERSLGAAGVKIDSGKMSISGNATLVVAGVANADQAKAIQKALEDAKYFQKVTATPKDGVGLIEVTAGTNGSTRARVEECLAKVAPAHKLQDVIWNSWSVEKAGP